jgi:hypothetical protein
MGSYNLDELIVLWEREKLTTEQTIGQILLALHALNERLRALALAADQGGGRQPGRLVNTKTFQRSPI